MIVRVIRIGQFALGCALLSCGAVAGAQLVSERVEGNRRLCTYRPSGLPTPIRTYTGSVDPGPRATEPDQNRIVRLDSWQTCPRLYPAHLEKRETVPPFAKLISSQRRSGEMFCVYRYLDRTYVVSRGTRLTCPVSPRAL